MTRTVRAVAAFVCASLNLKDMASVLTLSAKAAPFPYAAIAVASYTQNAEIIYDESISGIVLDTDGSKINKEEEIVKALAKSCGLSDDSVKVRSSTISFS